MCSLNVSAECVATLWFRSSTILLFWFLCIRCKRVRLANHACAFSLNFHSNSHYNLTITNTHWHVIAHQANVIISITASQRIHIYTMSANTNCHQIDRCLFAVKRSVCLFCMAKSEVMRCTFSLLCRCLFHTTLSLWCIDCFCRPKIKANNYLLPIYPFNGTDRMNILLSPSIELETIGHHQIVNQSSVSHCPLGKRSEIGREHMNQFLLLECNRRQMHNTKWESGQWKR